MSATDHLFADRLFADHQHLVLIVARRLAKRLPRRIDPDELFTAGLSGLWRAAQRFEPARGLKFSTYAERCIRGEIIDWLRIDGRARCKVQWPGPLPDDFDAAGPVEAPGRLLQCRELVEIALRVLTAKQRRAVQLCHLDGLTMQSAADRIGCIQPNVCLLLKAACARMRKRLEKEAPWTD